MSLRDPSGQAVRVRFAPSPTGYLHIGSARTALFNYLFARQQKGAFLLRIEDTDRKRSTEESVKTIFDGLKWLGLDYDEEPVFQSKRIESHKAAADKLEKEGKAYWQEDPEKGRALYLRIPRDQSITFEDEILGKITVDPASDQAYEKDLVIVKSDGSPTYNFAVVVDDADMKITHVIRGQDHISNTPKQVIVYQALGLTPPRFAHIPLIHDPQGKKLSKRKEHGVPVSIGEVISSGYLPGPFVNFLALLGWAPGDDKEIMTREELINLFTLARVNKSPAKFLPDKLEHLNGLEIRNMPLDDLVALCRPHLEEAFTLPGDEVVRAGIAQQQERLKKVRDIVDATRFLFSDEVEYQEKAVDKVLRKNDGFDVLEAVKEAMTGLDPFTPETIEAALKELTEKRGLKFKHVAQPIRVAMTGTMVSPPIHDTVAILGRARALSRIDSALQQRN